MGFYKLKKGMGFLEVLIILSFVSLLSVLSLKQYKYYIDEQKSLIAVSNVMIYQTAVYICFKKNNDIKSCNSGFNGLPTETTSKSNSIIQNINKLSVNNGSIDFTLTVNGRKTKKPIHLIYTPKIDGSMLTWTLSCSDYGEKSYISSCENKI